MKTQWLGGLLVVGAVVSAGFAAGGTAVYINGSRASSQVRMINGTPYVPLSDVAKAYGAQVTRRSDGDFEIAAAGGANQVGKFQGKLGQEVFTGQFKVSVISVEEPKSYQTKYRTYPATITAENAGQKLFVVYCRIKNGTPTKQSLVMAVGGDYGSPDTALTTMDEQSYTPIKWHGDESTGGIDVHEDKFAPTGIDILPGAARNVNLIFLLPTDAKPKDLIFCLTPYSEYAKGSNKKFTDVRISLNTP